ncbi:MAG: Gmad2 immunoglobulin-like domain-containing protein [Actinomycetota bacterium]
MRKFRLITLAAVLAFVGTACSSGGPGDGGSATTPTSTPTSSATSSPTPSMTTFEVWFGYGEWLFVTERTEPSGPRVGTAAVNALLAGPSAAERAAGVGTSIPEGTELLGLSIDGGVATVDLSRTFESGGGSLSMFSRLAQLTYTLTQFPTVHGVNLELDGKPVTVFSGEGIILEQPMTRRSYRDRLPAILVQSPLIGEQVSSPVTISGTANVFEATVSITILDAQGTEIASDFTTATCGTGCRGTYSTAVAFTVDQSQTGTVRVYEASAKDGRPINVVDIPVVLLP